MIEELTQYWEPWEVGKISNLHVYLEINSVRTFPPCPIIDGVTGEVVGQETQYIFRDHRNIIVIEYDNGKGRIIVAGEGNLEERLDELKSILDFKKLARKD